MSESSRWIWGRRPVLEALKAGKVERVLVVQSVEPQFRRSVEEAAREVGASFEIVDRTRIDGIVPSGKAQGVAASIHSFETGSVEQILARTAATPPALLLVLEEIQDPRNLGSLIRSGDAAGCHGVIVTEYRSAPLSGVVSKASAGAMHHVPLAPSGNMSRLIEQLKEAGIWTVGLADAAPLGLYEFDLTVPVAIFVGGEGSGLRRLTAERVDALVSIPMHGHVESLNASVAGAIALFEAVRQRIAGSR